MCSHLLLLLVLLSLPLLLPQARAVIDGLPADMVALALPLDVQKICDAGLISPNWTNKYPERGVGELGGLDLN